MKTILFVWYNRQTLEWRQHTDLDSIFSGDMPYFGPTEDLSTDGINVVKQLVDEGEEEYDVFPTSLVSARLLRD